MVKGRFIDMLDWEEQIKNTTYNTFFHQCFKNIEEIFKNQNEDNYGDLLESWLTV